MSILSKGNARKIIEKYCYSEPEEINIETLLYAENLVIKDEPLNSCEGKIVFNNEKGIVTINSAITDTRHRNFIMAHELGHFVNEKEQVGSSKDEVGSKKELRKCGFEELYGRDGRARETDANDFAAELLMPKEWFNSFVKGKTRQKNGGQALDGRLIEEIAKFFNVSLTAAAIRYSEVGARECAVVLSKDGIVKWSSINKAFKYQFIRPKNKVNTLSYTSDFFKGNEIPKTEEEIPAEAWFYECFNIDKRDKIFEYNVPMPRYNTVLSLVWMR